MQTLLTVALPYFALIFCGYGAGRWRLLSADAVAGLNSFVFYFALPALLFFKMAAAPLSALLQWRFLLAYAGASILAFLFAALAGRLVHGSGLKENAIQGMAGAFPNVGYLGLPLVIGAFGADAAVPAAMVLMIGHLVILPATTFMIEADGKSQHRLAHVLVTSGQGLLRNPLIAASLAGVAIAVLGIPLPLPFKAFGGLLGTAAGPCALFALGATLVGGPISDRIGEVTTMTATKLLVHPAAAAVLALFVLRLDPYLAGIVILEASLPIGANVFVMARAYDVYAARSSSAILLSTLLSVVTVSTLLIFLAPHS